MRGAISDTAMRAVVIVLLDPARDRRPRFLHVAILGRPHFFFLQAAMEPFYVTVAFRMIIGGASMGDPQPIQSFDKARRSELCSVVGGEGHPGIPTAFWQTRKYGLFNGIEGFFRPTTMRQIPTYDFPGATVDHTH